MKTRYNQSTEQKLATRKRLRLICEWFRNLNEEIKDLVLPKQGLPGKVVDKINAQNFDPVDLIAIRNRPGEWTQRDPYKWLWILHRYQNHRT